MPSGPWNPTGCAWAARSPFLVPPRRGRNPLEKWQAAGSGRAMRMASLARPSSKPQSGHLQPYPLPHAQCPKMWVVGVKCSQKAEEGIGLEAGAGKARAGPSTVTEIHYKGSVKMRVYYRIVNWMLVLLFSPVHNCKICFIFNLIQRNKFWFGRYYGISTWQCGWLSLVK